ncbi:MAG: M20/M25/M40 family metallo-hydrolase [Candidatus Nitrosothermus koennekii]|nr:MAG: M20/M25/M40 family metallo-hydrolase [Candidatus Nitrosothermus koennekii]
MQEIRRYVEKNKDDIISDLRNLVKHPSISAQNVGMEECAATLNGILRDAGVTSSIKKPEDGNPIVIGEIKGSSDKTLLFYSHYDVQPVEPIEAWRYNPFSGVVADDKIHGRGAADSKGNVVAMIKAVKYYVDTVGEPPVNIKFLIEGEEEISSVNLPKFVEDNKDRLKADATICFDGSLNQKGAASIYAGLKGMLYVELRCRTASVDMHSGLAPIVPNPAWRLLKALQTIRNDAGKIMIDKWYDDVKVPTKEDLALLRKLDYDEKMIMVEYGIKGLINNVKGKTALKKLLFDPTCNIAGIHAGYTGPGSKTVLPSMAYAKLDFRLVYDQDPDKLIMLIRKHLDKEGFKDIELYKFGSLKPSKTSPKAKIVKAASTAAKETFGLDPSIFPNMWGSGPDFVFTKILQQESIWTGCSPAYANIHAPNEFTGIRNVLDGVCYAAMIMQEFSKLD